MAQTGVLVMIGVSQLISFVFVMNDSDSRDLVSTGALSGLIGMCSIYGLVSTGLIVWKYAFLKIRSSSTFNNLATLLMIAFDFTVVGLAASRLYFTKWRALDLLIMWLLLAGSQAHMSNIMFFIRTIVTTLPPRIFYAIIVMFLSFAAAFPIVTVSRLMTWSFHRTDQSVSGAEIENLRLVVDFFGFSIAGAAFATE